MSITTRLWSDEDLAKIGKDMKLTTIFMNASTFSEKGIKRYPYHLRKTYVARLDTINPDDEPITVHATSDAMARWFIGQEYNGNIVWMDEIITKARSVPLKSGKKKRKTKRATAQAGVRGVR